MSESAWTDPLEGLARDLDFDTVAEDVATLYLPREAGLPLDDPQSLRWGAYLGIYDVLSECVIDGAPDREAAARSLEGALRIVEATEGPLRFDLHHKRTQAERQELVARMRGREEAMTERWMLPRLEQDIDAYRRRIAALRRALDENGEGQT